MIELATKILTFQDIGLFIIFYIFFFKLTKIKAAN